MESKKLQHTWLLILFVLSILIAGIKYYLMFFSSWDKNITDNLAKIEQSLQNESGKLEWITYRQLVTSYDKMSLNEVKIWQININDSYIKVWKDRYYFYDFNINYPNIVTQFEYGDKVDLEFISYKEKRFITWLSPYKNITNRLESEFLLVWNKKIESNIKLSDSIEWKEYKVIYTRETEFREKQTFVKVEEDTLTEFLNKFNSNTTTYKVLRLEWVIDQDIFYATKVIYWIIYEDEKKVLNELTSEYTRYTSDLEKNMKISKDLWKREELDKLSELYKSIWLEYSLEKSIYGNLNSLTEFYTKKQEWVIEKYGDLFKKPN